MLFFVFLFYFNHLNHQDINCESCHNFENPKTFIETQNNKSCEKCHKENKIYYFKLELENIIKFNHLKHSYLKCEKCHKTPETFPEMDYCLSCHKEKENYEYKCSDCHKYNNNTRFITNYNNKVFKPKNHNNFNYKNKHNNFNDENYCYQCHQKQYCSDCHNAKKDLKTFHSTDYLTIHKYEKNFSSCQSCHENNKSCNSCHQKTALDFESKKYKYKKDFSVHPLNWETKHQKEAKANIYKCQSCHNESSCLKCHKDTNNPHKNDKNICDKKNTLKKSCVKCHENINELCK